MACTGCKKKAQDKDWLNNVNTIGNKVKWFIIIWALLGLYGFIHLISLIF